METNTNHRHEFTLSHTFWGKVTRALFYVSICDCGKKQIVCENGTSI